VHFNIIPKYPNGAGLGVGWKPTKLAEGEEMASAIRDAF
jgi:hypothetical protein